MARPKGSKNKDIQDVLNEVKVEDKPNVQAKEEKEETRIPVLNKCSHGPICQCQDPLTPGQAYFEDGPTGIHIIGEDSKDQVWYRGGNGGRGYFINKKR